MCPYVFLKFRTAVREISIGGIGFKSAHFKMWRSEERRVGKECVSA